MRYRPDLFRGLLFSVGFLLVQPGLAQSSFSAFDAAVELEVPPEPVVPSTLAVQAHFVPALRTTLDPAREIVDLRFVPPEPVVPPDPIQPRPTDWVLSFAPGCFIERRSGQFRVEDYTTCGLTLSRFFDDGTSVDLTDRILFLEADIKPPSGNQTEWRFRVDMELEAVPPEPIFPPEPIRGSTVLTIGNDAGEAVNSFVGWAGKQPVEDG